MSFRVFWSLALTLCAFPGLAGAVCHVLTSGVLAGGFGGRLGFSALMGVLAYERVLLPGLLHLRG